MKLAKQFRISSGRGPRLNYSRNYKMTIETKILRQGDEHLLQCLAPGVFDDPLIPQITQEFLSDSRHHLAVAIEGGLVIGFASAVHYIHPDKPQPEMWINEVGVAPDYQRRGVGQAILRALLALARDLNCSEAWVLTERPNTPAMKLYSSLNGIEATNVGAMFTFFLD